MRCRCCDGAIFSFSPECQQLLGVRLRRIGNGLADFVCYPCAVWAARIMGIVV
jgi:hypothetical protein